MGIYISLPDPAFSYFGSGHRDGSPESFGNSRSQLKGEFLGLDSGERQWAQEPLGNV